MLGEARPRGCGASHSNCCAMQTAMYPFHRRGTRTALAPAGRGPASVSWSLSRIRRRISSVTSTLSMISSYRLFKVIRLPQDLLRIAPVVQIGIGQAKNAVAVVAEHPLRPAVDGLVVRAFSRRTLPAGGTARAGPAPEGADRRHACSSRPRAGYLFTRQASIAIPPPVCRKGASRAERSSTARSPFVFTARRQPVRTSRRWRRRRRCRQARWNRHTRRWSRSPG